MHYQWDFGPVWRGFGFLMGGLLGTIELSAAAILAGFGVGLALTALRMAAGRPGAIVASAIIAFYRNTPPLVHLFFVFYGLPILIGISLSPFVSALIALSIQTGAFLAEVFRGGIVSIERGQWEAARALGMSGTAVLRRVVLPQAVRRMIPPLMERSFELIKTTTLAATLTYSELLYRAMTLVTQSFRPVEIYSAVAVIFLCLLTSLSFVMRFVESRLRIAQR
jgi:polar amino acid transport system permease protein